MTIYVGFEIELEKEQNIVINRDQAISDLSKKAKDITHITNHTILGYHNSSSMTHWRLESDASLQNGAEFISPPKNVDIALNKLSKFFKCIEDSDCTTSDRCGLHINMSSTSKTLDDIDISSFITKINTRMLFKYWGNRLINNRYIRNMRDIINTHGPTLASFKLSDSSELKKRLDTVSNSFLCGRHNFVNLRAGNDGRTIKKYLEIRVVGGENYHKRFDDVKNTVKYFEKLMNNSRTKKKTSKIVELDDVQIYDMKKKDKKRYKSMISYVNRAKTKVNDSNDLFIPSSNIIHTCNIDERIRSIKNIHKYTIEVLAKRLYNIPSLAPMLYRYHIRNGTSSVITSFSSNKHYSLILSKYIDACIKFITLANVNKIQRTTYILYHFTRFIYNNYGKKQCLVYMRNNLHFIDFKRFIPKDEDFRNILWVFDCFKNIDKQYRNEFVSGLSLNMVNYLLKYRKKGMVVLARQKKKELLAKKVN